ncbi:MAG: hypothetical protein R3C59_05715 [Planctomycetaceae bacterium]
MANSKDDAQVFDENLFRTLDSIDELNAYCQQWLTAKSRISDADLDGLMAGFDELDDPHRVYAIELLAAHGAKGLGPILLHCLVSTNTAVACAASRAVFRMPTSQLDEVFERELRNLLSCADTVPGLNELVAHVQKSKQTFQPPE